MGWDNVGDMLINSKFKNNMMPSFAQSPEMKKKSYNSPTDVWSIGLIMSCFCPKVEQWSKDLFSYSDKMKEEYGLAVEEFPKIKIFNLTLVRFFLEEMLVKNTKKRMDLFKLEFYEFYKTRIKTENPEDFIMASKLIFAYLKKNILLESLKKLYAK